MIVYVQNDGRNFRHDGHVVSIYICQTYLTEFSILLLISCSPFVEFRIAHFFFSDSMNFEITRFNFNYFLC